MIEKKSLIFRGTYSKETNFCKNLVQIKPLNERLSAKMYYSSTEEYLKTFKYKQIIYKVIGIQNC